MIRKLSLALAAALVAAPALAAEDPAGPTATAPVASTADQIEAFLHDSPVTQLPADSEPVGVTSADASRQPHGVVSVGVGTHGYRSVYMRSDLPIGRTGMLSVAIGDTRFNGGGYGRYGGYGGYGGWDQRSVGVSLSAGGAAGYADGCRGRMAPAAIDQPHWPAAGCGGFGR